MTILIRYSLKILTSNPNVIYDVNSNSYFNLGLTVLRALRNPEVNKNWRA